LSRFGIWDYRNPVTVNFGGRRFELSITQTSKVAYARKTRPSIDDIWGWEIRDATEVLRLGDVIYLMPDDLNDYSGFTLGFSTLSQIYAFKGPYAAVLLKELEPNHEAVPRVMFWIHTRFLYIPEQKRRAAAMGLAQFPDFHPIDL
jgi:hypothetical protein